jgi:hypothetical protein
MKKPICVNVDIDVLMMAKQKIPNISEYLNECLKGVVGITHNQLKESDLKEQITNIDNSMRDLNIKRGILEMELKVFKEKIAEEERLLKERELFKRWVCPVCKQQNVMSEVRCSGSCGLPTRDSPKTTFIYLNNGVDEQ